MKILRRIPLLLVLLAGTCFGQFISFPSTTVTTTSVTINWTTSTSADGILYWGPTAKLIYNSKWDSLLGSHSNTLSGLKPGTTYYFKLMARDAMLQYVRSATLTFTTLAVPVQHTVTLNWGCGDLNGSPCINPYNVYRGTVSGGPYTQITTGLVNPTYVDATVPSGTTFYYVVTSTNGSNESAHSNEVPAVIPYP